jgi:peptidyl-prolyl cis-trans isomerase SurA
MKQKQFRPATMLATALAASAALLLPPPAGARTVNRILATVDGEPITYYQMETFVHAASPGADPANLTDAERSRVLDMLISDTLIRVESEAAGISASNEEINAYVEQIKKRNNLDDARLQEALQAQGLTMEQYREQVKRELQRSALLAKQIKSHVNVSQEEVEKYYNEHQDEFSAPESIKVRHIFFLLPPDAPQSQVDATAARAHEAYQRIANGEDFDKVGRDMANGSPPARTDDLGTIHKGQMMPALEKVAFSLKKGEPSQPLRSDVGVHILLVDERETSSQTKLADVQDQIKEKLYSSALESRFQRWIDEDLRKGHEVVIK